MFSPRVSIIIPVYNGTNFLRESIDSALSQSWHNCEVIVVNDGSDDDGKTESLALSYGDSIRYIRKKNGGVATALNLGIQLMQGDFFCWLSHDDVFLPEKCKVQVLFWEQCGDDRGIVYSDVDMIDEIGRRIPGNRLPDIGPEDAMCRIWGESFLNGCALLIPRALLIEAGGFNSGMATTQDYDLWLRLARIATFRHLPQVVMLSRRHGGQGSRLRAHRRECAELLSAHVPALLAHVRKQPEGFSSRAASVLANGTVSRVGDYGFFCAKLLFLAFRNHASIDEQRMLCFALLRRLPYGVSRLLWLQLPEMMRMKLGSTLIDWYGQIGKFASFSKQGGMRVALDKSVRYAFRIVGRFHRVLSASPASDEIWQARSGRDLSVIIDHDSGGGVQAYREQLSARILSQGSDVLLWQFLHGTGYCLFELRTEGHRRLFRTRDLDHAFAFVQAASPATIFFNNMAGWSRLASVMECLVNLRKSGARLEVFLHDYFALCPAYPLLSRTGMFCGVPMPPEPCRKCLPGHPLAAPHDGMDIVAWREMWRRFLSQTDVVAAADDSVRELFVRVFPELEQRIAIIPHEAIRPWKPLVSQHDGVLPPVVGVIGDITRHKGAGIVEDLVRLIEKRRLDIRLVVIGSMESSLRSNILKITGRYEHDKLPLLLQEHGVRVCLVPSPLPETFCYVAQEVEMLALPLVCLDIGAQGARARRYAKGYVAASADAEGCLDAVQAALRSKF